MTDHDNEQDITGAVIAKIKQLFESRTALIVMAAVIAAAAAVIFTAAVTSGRSAEEFESLSALAQTAEAERNLHFTKGGLSVTMRIADICSADEKSGETYTSLYYANDYDEKYVFADYIIKNKSSKPVTVNCGLNSEDSLDLFLGYFHDVSDKWEDDDENDFIAFYKLYDRSEKDVVPKTEIVIGAKETKEFTLRYTMRSSDINKCSGVYFCGQYKDSSEFTKYDVMGIGRPVISYGFKNSELFPQLVRNETAAEKKTSETYAESYETTAALKYQMQKINSNSPVFTMINNAGNPYKLSVEIAAEGNAESNLAAMESGYSAAVDNESIQGSVVELVYKEGLEVEKVKLIFEIEESARANVLGKYSETSEEFEGIKRFNVFMYDEEINMQLPIETKFDLDNNIVYAETDRCGTYSLVDMEIWFDMLGIGTE